MDKIFSKFEHVVLGTRVVYYKNRSFSRKAVLFGKVLGKVGDHIKLCEMQTHSPVCTERIYNI